MPVETIYTFKNYLYIVKSGFLSQNNSWGRFFYKTIIPLVLVRYEMIIVWLAIGYLSSHIQRALVE